MDRPSERKMGKIWRDAQLEENVQKRRDIFPKKYIISIYLCHLIKCIAVIFFIFLLGPDDLGLSTLEQTHRFQKMENTWQHARAHFNSHNSCAGININNEYTHADKWSQRLSHAFERKVQKCHTAEIDRKRQPECLRGKAAVALKGRRVTANHAEHAGTNAAPVCADSEYRLEMLCNTASYLQLLTLLYKRD